MKKLLKIIGIIVFLILVAGFFFPTTNDFEKSILIKAPVDDVFLMVNDLEKWPEWSPWIKSDPDIVINYGKTSVGKGAEYEWFSESMGDGSLWISESFENNRIVTNIDFGGGSPPQGIFSFKEVGGGTRVSWRFINENGWNPVGRLIGGIFIAPMVEDSYDEGLVFLDEATLNYVKNKPAIPIEEVSSEGINYIGIRVLMPMDSEEIGARMGELYGKLGSYLEENDIAMAGMPMTIYYENEDGTLDMECALPTDNLVNTGGDEIVGKKTFAGNLIRGTHMGDYSKLDASHFELIKFVMNNELEQVGEMYEIYITDPGMVPDTSQWQTDIFIPIAGLE